MEQVAIDKGRKRYIRSCTWYCVRYYRWLVEQSCSSCFFRPGHVLQEGTSPSIDLTTIQAGTTPNFKNIIYSEVVNERTLEVQTITLSWLKGVVHYTAFTVFRSLIQRSKAEYRVMSLANSNCSPVLEVSMSLWNAATSKYLGHFHSSTTLEIWKCFITNHDIIAQLHKTGNTSSVQICKESVSRIEGCYTYDIVHSVGRGTNNVTFADMLYGH